MKNTIITSIALLSSLYGFSQVGIGTITPNSSAALDITSTARGLLPPRMTTAQRNLIASPANGLVIFNTETNSFETKNSTDWTSSVAVNTTTAGDMSYWNGTAWTRVPAGTNGQTLTYISGAPVWRGSLPANTVVSNGKIWMDRNLGATQVATSSTDAASYGDLYQWGRGTDGHQIRTSLTTSTLSATDTPGNGLFITTAATDWRSTPNYNLWLGVNGANNPCPNGFRLPTITELEIERISWSSQNSLGASTSPLKLPMAGYRQSNGNALMSVGVNGYYWTSSNISSVYRLGFDSSSSSTSSTSTRTDGLSVRCVKE